MTYLLLTLSAFTAQALMFVPTGIAAGDFLLRHPLDFEADPCVIPGALYLRPVALTGHGA